MVEKIKLKLFKKKFLYVGFIMLIGISAAYFAFDHLDRDKSEVKGDAVENNSAVDPTTGVVVVSVDTPDETPIDINTYNWVGEPDSPKLITIPSINLTGFVQKVGNDQENRIAVPTNTNLAGWYINSAKLGEKGLSIVVGHLNGRFSDGIFYNLSLLEAGEQFQVQLGNSNILNYEIVDKVTVTEEEANQYLFSQQNNISSQLNLITCGGEYDDETKTYTDRVIVYSKLVVE